MATHASILAWRIPRTEEPGGYSPLGHKESDTTATQQSSQVYIEYFTFSSLINCNLSVVVAPCVQLKCLYSSW